jgi:hypothetical protein
MMADFAPAGNIHNGPMPIRSAIVAAVFLLAACANGVLTSNEPSAAPSSSPSPSSQPIASGSSLPTPAPSGFGFSVEAVIGYYETQGFVCDEIQPSATAAGYFFQACQKLDSDGRTLALGFITDASGDLADGYASVQRKEDDPILEPAAAMDHLAGFLGAMLGDERGTSLLEWLAGHLGDTYASTTIDVLSVATYTPSEADHSRLYLEIANQDYMDAPAPSGL